MKILLELPSVKGSIVGRLFTACQRLTLLFIFICSFLFTSAVFANPVLGNVASGNVSIQQSSNSTVINQSSQKAIINWQSFNINAQESTHFQQPAGGIALNRINPAQGVSQIYGTLTATGQIILVNPAGIFFGPSAYVNVGGMIATTGNITDQNFLNGNYQFSKVSPYSGAVINEGQIIAAEHGLIALVAPGVINNGLIQANLGHVILASGDAFTINFSGDNLINFSITAPTSQPGVDQNGNRLRDGVRNTGSLIADGGTILVTASAASGILDNIINMQGVAQARSVSQQNGEIIISGDPNAGIVDVAGKLDASGKNAGEKGGNVTITGNEILLNSPAVVDVSGDQGGGNINIGGSAHGAGPLPNASATVLMPNTNLIADAVSFGNGGNIVVWSDNLTKAYGNISARGGLLGGEGGFVETSSHQLLDVNNISVDTSAPAGKMGTWLLDPSDLTISTSSDSNVTSSSPFEPSTQSSNSVLNVTTLTNALASGNVTVQTVSGAGPGSGDITVATPITWSSSNTLSLTAFNKIFLNADITAANGGLNLSATNSSQSITSGSEGSPSSTGVTANISVSNFNLVQGQWYQVNSTLPTFSITNNFQINSGVMPASAAQFIRATGGNGTSGSPYVLTDIYGVQGIGSNSTTLGDSYQLGSNISASQTSNWNSGAGFVPIGNSTTPFTGTLDGTTSQDTINNLFINLSSGGVDTGLFGDTKSSTISNLGLVSANITGSYTNTGGIVGGNGVVSGSSNTNITNVFVTGSVASTGGGNVGGIVGELENGTVSKAYNTASVSQPGCCQTGGIVGFISTAGVVTTSYNAGTVTNTTGGGTSIGGLVGGMDSTSTVSNSYNIGTVNNNSAPGGQIGGLVGNNNGASISDSYSTGPVLGTASFVGGFAGINSGTISNSFWDTTTSGKSSGVGSGSSSGLTGGCFTGSGCTGGATANLSAQSTYTGAGWSFGTSPSSGTWFSIDGSTRPMLQMEYSTSITTAHQLQLMAMSLSSSYSLTGNVNTSGITNSADVWGSTGFVPVGNSTSNFTGSLNGNNYQISNFYINLPSSSNVGLFGYTSTAATIQNVGISGTVIGGSNTGSLVGTNSGTVNNDYASEITVTGSNTNIGGLVGLNTTSSGLVKNSRSSGIVTNTNDNTGGLVGTNDTNAIVEQSFSSASVSSTGGFATGGLVGWNKGTVQNAYTTGSVSGTGLYNGGLVGTNTGTVNDSFSSAYVTTVGTNNGGLVGYNQFAASLTENSFWDTDTSGLTTGVSLNDGTVTNVQGGCFSGSCTNGGTVNLSSLSPYTTAGWNTSTIWSIISGQSYPYLLTIYSSTPRAISGTSPASAATKVQLATSGSVIDTAYAGANGFFYFLEGNGTVSDGSGVLAYLDSGSTVGNVVASAPSSGGSLSGSTGLSITANAVTAGANSGSSTLSNSALSTALGSLSDSHILYSVSSNNLTLLSGDAFIVTSPTTYSLDGNISATSSNMTFNGAVTLSTNATLTTTTSGNITLAGNITGGGNGLIINTAGSGSVISGVLSGTGTTLTKQGSGTLSLNSANSYTGATTISAGTLKLGIANALPTGTALSDSSTLDLNNFSQQIGSVTGSGTVTNSGGTAATLTVNNSTSDSFAGLISGNLALTKSNSGTLTLLSANTYTGATTISAGTIANGIANALPTGTALSDNGTLDLSGFAQQVASVTGSGTVTNSSGTAVTFTVNNSASDSFAGVISGNLALTKLNSGTLTLSGASTYTGATTISAGTMANGIDNALPIGTALSDSGTLDLNNFSQQVGSVTGSGTVTNSGATAGTFTINNSGSDSFSGLISGNIALTKSNSGTLTLLSANTYTGPTSISAGTIANGIANAIPTGTSLSDSGTLDLSGFAQQVASVTGSGTVTNSSGTAAILTINNSGSDSFAGAISGNLAFTKLNSGTLTLSGASTYTGTTTISAGTIANGINNALPIGTSLSDSGTLDLNGFAQQVASVTGSGTVTNSSGTAATLTVNNSASDTFAGSISGNVALTKSNSGTFVLSGVNTYTGATIINAGTLQAGINNAISSNSAVTLLNVAGAFLDLNNFNDTIASLSGGGTSGGNVTLGSGTLTTGDNSNTTYSGVISGSGNLIKQGSGTFTLSNTNSYTGSTAINAGTIADGINNALPTGTALSDNGTFDLNNFSQQVASLTGSGTVTNSGATAGTFTINNSASDSFAGSISGNLALTKSNSGTLSLSSANSYTGATTLNAGTIANGIDNALPTGTALSNNGTLDLNNFSQQVASVTGSGTVTNSGATAGTFTINNNASDSFAGLLSGNLALTKSNSGTLTLSNANTYSGITSINAGTVTITNAQSLGATSAGTTINSGGTLNINVTGVNEPITLNGGTLAGTGTASLAGAITLTTGSSDSISANTGSIFTINGDVNGAGALALQGAGTIDLIGNIGNTTPVTSFSANANASISGSVTASGNQTYNNPITLTANTSFSSSSGDILFNNIITGGFDLTVSSSGTTTFANVVGGTPLNSLTVNSAAIDLNGGSVSTVGSQNYTGAITLGADTTLSTTGSGSNSISINSGVSGSHNLTLSGNTSGNDSFTLSGAITVNNVAVTGGSSGTNSLAVNTGSTQNWNINSSNSGSINGLSGFSGSFTFSNIANLTGGSGNDTFSLAGGTLSGSVNGSSGTNTLTADNVANTWNVTSANAGTVTGISGSFSNIQNLTGGNLGNTFIFANNASLSGYISGGSLSQTNTLNYSAYVNPISVILTSINNGKIQNSQGTLASFGNINNLVGQLQSNNSIQLPNKSNTIVITGAGTGYINDPTNFNGFTTFYSTSGNDHIIFNTSASINTNTDTASINGTTMVFNNFGPNAFGSDGAAVSNTNISQILQQSTTTTPVVTSNNLNWVATSVNQNINDMVNQIAQAYDYDLNKIKINPYCTAQ